MKVLLTGSNGQLGRELRRQLVTLNNQYTIISTDYDTLDITNLEQVKGCILTQSPDIVIIRTAWLYGDGNNFVRTMLKLAKTNPELNVVADQFGSPTYTKDLAKAIIALMHTEYYGTYHGTCEGQCSWYDFARKIFELKGMQVKVNKVTSEEFVRLAKRPKYSVLDNFNLKLYGLNEFRDWEEALADYLEEDIAWQNSNL